MRASGDRPSEAAARLTTQEDLAVYAAVIASALDAVVVVDEAGVVISTNPAAEAMFGYGPDEAVGRPIADLIVPPHMRAAHEAGMARYRATRCLLYTSPSPRD